MKIIVSLASILFALCSFTLLQEDPTGCGCGSMASGKQIIYSVESGPCCSGQANDEPKGTVLFWVPGEQEGSYEISKVQLITNAQAQGLCCNAQ